MTTETTQPTATAATLPDTAELAGRATAALQACGVDPAAFTGDRPAHGAPHALVEGTEVATVLLTSGEIELTLVDRAVAHPPPPLEGTTWTVETIRSADAVSSTPAGATATLTMMACEGAEGELEDSVLEVLNAGELEVSIEGDTLTLTAGDLGLGLRGEE